MSDSGDVSEPGLRGIGDIARSTGVTTRTLRYYQEVGLLTPSSATRRGNRLYSDADVARLARILELRDVMGFDLDRIRLILGTEDRLEQFRAEARMGISSERRREMVHEAMELNDRIRIEIDTKINKLQGLVAELDARATRYNETLAELDTEPAPTH
jgi:DNA-binding transcriptional MerR regulator